MFCYAVVDAISGAARQDEINAEGFAGTQQGSQFGGDARVLFMQSCVVVDQDQDCRQRF